MGVLACAFSVQGCDGGGGNGVSCCVCGYCCSSREKKLAGVTRTFQKKNRLVEKLQVVTLKRLGGCIIQIIHYSNIQGSESFAGWPAFTPGIALTHRVSLRTWCSVEDARRSLVVATSSSVLVYRVNTEPPELDYRCTAAEIYLLGCRRYPIFWCPATL